MVVNGILFGVMQPIIWDTEVEIPCATYSTRSFGNVPLNAARFVIRILSFVGSS